MKLREFGAVLFDLDGTLADSMQVWDNLCHDWAVSRGLCPPPDLQQAIALMTLDEAAQYVIQRFALALAPRQIQQEWDALLLRRYREQAKPKPGARALLHALSRAGIALGVATSTSSQACEGFLEANQLAGFFGAVTYTHHAGRDKTHPDVYLACAKALGVQPGQCAVVEDLPAALQGVRAAGMAFVAVYDPATSPADWQMLTRQADLAVRSLEELCCG